MSAVIVIPARFGSTRFPGKPLARLTGKFLIQHVCEQVEKARRAARVVVATDDVRIVDAVKSFGGYAVMTSPNHPSGTCLLYTSHDHPCGVHHGSIFGRIGTGQ